MTAMHSGGDDDSRWYKDAVFYELHVRAFADSNGDGIGDFQGLIGRLDYLRDLGVTTIWLLPFFPSPLLDDGYDISDYTAVHPAYGTLDDFHAFLDEAHKRDLRVIIELVLNHTSDQHPWFQRARRAPGGSSARDFYVWSDSPDKYREARVIFTDSEASNWSWDPLAGAYFWHRFYAHQPDLNFEHAAVREAMLEVVDFWLDLGIDGMRLDAVPYIVEQEATSSENLPRTHQILKDLRRHIDDHYPGRMLLAEANQWPEDAVAYFGDGDECQMAFHFPLMPRLFMALRAEDRLPVIDIMAQTPAIPEACQWALFLRNHDELTLEMVTDDERLYMYRSFAHVDESRINLGIRHRLAPLLENSRRRIELMNALLCSLPGTPVIYYGDEIGMGDNVYLGDRDGVRTPMQWSADRNAGFSSAPPQRLYLPLIVDYEYHHEMVHVEAQESNAHSLLAYMKRLLALRRRHRAFGRGDITFLEPSNHRILAFIREYEGKRILVVANLSRFGQAFELDLGDCTGMVPMELFGRTPFWPIDEAPYKLALGPHAFYWFALTPAPVAERMATDAGVDTLPLIVTEGAWTDLLTGRGRGKLEEALPRFLGNQPWFRGQPASILTVTVIDAVPLRTDGTVVCLTPVTVTYSDRDADTYLLALCLVPVEDEGHVSVHGSGPIARIRTPDDGEALLIDAIESGVIDDALQGIVFTDREPLPGTEGEVMVLRNGENSLDDVVTVTSHISRRDGAPLPEGERLLVKFLRHLNEGVNPEWEMGVALTGSGFAQAPKMLGALEYRRPRHGPVILAVLQRFVPNEGNAWDLTLEALHQYVVEALAQGLVMPAEPMPATTDLLGATEPVPPQPLTDLIGASLSFARLIGQRTADLHSTMATIEGSPTLSPEPFTDPAQRSLYQTMRGLTARVLRALRHALPNMPDDERIPGEAIMARGEQINARFATVLTGHLTGSKIRGHGDFHLRQVLRTGDDVVIIDFGGEPDRYFEERRLRISPMRDVASMLHSFYTAAIATARDVRESGVSAEEPATIDALLQAWYRWSAAAFLDAYQQGVGAGSFLPVSRDERALLLDALMLEKAIYELGYTLSHSPEGNPLAMQVLLHLLGEN